METLAPAFRVGPEEPFLERLEAQSPTPQTMDELTVPAPTPCSQSCWDW